MTKPEAMKNELALVAKVKMAPVSSEVANFPALDSPTKIRASETAPPLSVILARVEAKQKSEKDDILEVALEEGSTGRKLRVSW